MPRQNLPLIGLLEDSILPGEERAFAVPTVDASTLAALARLRAESPETPPRLLALTISSSVELPSLVSARWGTICELTEATATTITLRGQSRAKLISARGKDSPYKAELDTPADEDAPPDPRELIDATHTLLATLHAGATPDPADWPERLRPALLALVRAIAATSELPELLQYPPAEAIRKLANKLAARAQPQKASEELETMILETMGKSELTKALRQRLWSQIVEIQKRLDIYDPAVAEEGDDATRLQRRLMQAGLPKLARETAKRELRLLRSMQSNHHDYSTYLSHLDFMARLPWQPDPERPIDIDEVARALDRAHTGLDKAKKRVLEFLAVRALGGESSSMILCLSGPPGVGKTTIARAMAEALGRPFVRVPLGGVHDESEIRGHRITFVAAHAGRILKGLAQAGSASALVLLDEIDKVGADRQRSPMAALLEVLDPEQNPHFQDNYLGVPYDLSNVLFIATANDTSLIHPTLLDRMEPVEIDGYTTHEKTGIARSHLLERLRAEHGLPETPTIDDDALNLVIEAYTREAGVRQLRRALASIFRDRALSLVRERASHENTAAPITCDEITRVLGPPRHTIKTIPDALPVGVATGMSVGPTGGSILFVEVGLMPGKGELALTGRLGDVLQESAHAALAHLRVHPELYGIEREKLTASNIHLHLPEAATAKDGPSAGTAIFAALVSVFANTPLPSDLAFTGEISLTGRVLPVGGIRPKLLAAERAGVRRVIIPKDNHADVPPDIRLEVITAERLAEVFHAAFPELAAKTL